MRQSAFDFGAQKSLVQSNPIHVSKSTFKAGLTVPFHRWFRLTASFAPDLVRTMLDELKCDASEVVLDPFSGAGTTLLECQLRGIRGIGFEINPLLHFVCKTSLNWKLSSRLLRETLSAVEAEFSDCRARLLGKTPEESGLPIPAIHNVYRWWRADVLLDLMILKQAIGSLSRPDERDFLLLAACGVLVPDLTNVTLGRLQLHFIDRTDAKIDVWTSFSQHALSMISDLEKLEGVDHPAQSFCHHQNSTVGPLPITDCKVNVVVTSPPYPNRYSYVWNTRPHLYFLDLLEHPKQAAELDKKTIGGTWGTATSCLAKGIIEPQYDAVRDAVGPIASQIREHDNLMANYVMKYFNSLAQQIVTMNEVLSPNARVAYVVGCSWLKDVYVETDVLLGKIFDGLGLGYKTERIDRIRQRHSGDKLHESIVYAWKR